MAVKKGDIIKYAIRVYNEGEVAGYANEVKDYLPPYLIYVEDSAINKKYGWQISENGRIATTSYLSNKEISEFDGTKLAYEDLQIECKISENAIPDESITNIAEISEYKYGDTVITQDIDSKSDNITEKLPEDEKLPDYKKGKIEAASSKSFTIKSTVSSNVLRATSKSSEGVKDFSIKGIPPHWLNNQ